MARRLRLNMERRAMDWIEVNGVSLRYDLTGTGEKTIVLVHEMGGSLETWDYMLPALIKRWRVLRYDTREAGFSEKTGHVPGIATMTNEIAGLLDALNIIAPVAIAGCALGGAIAMHFAASHPHRGADGDESGHYRGERSAGGDFGAGGQ